MSKQKRSQTGKKKLTRNILIGVAIAVVIAAIIFLAITLQTDGAGMNWFQRRATVASADGVKLNMIEYRVALNSEAQNNVYVQYYSMLGMTIEDVQEGVAQSALLRKIYIKEAKARGITLTKEEQDACKKEAQDTVDAVASYYKEYMVQNGTYTKTALEKQIADYYRQFGMNQNEYYAYVKENAEASYYEQKLQKQVTDAITEDEVQKYYHETAEASMTTVGEDGEEKPAYEEGKFWAQMNQFLSNSSSSLLPMLYVPEGFIYTDFIQIEGMTTAEVSEVIRQVKEGEKSFDELMNSDANVYAYRETFKGPYPIAEYDHKELFAENEAYAVVSALAVGEIDGYVVPAAAAESESESDSESESESTKVTAYLFRRANGTLCEEGESGVIKMDAIPGLKDRIEAAYQNKQIGALESQWLSDLKFEKALYTYKGALE